MPKRKRKNKKKPETKLARVPLGKNFSTSGGDPKDPKVISTVVDQLKVDQASKKAKGKSRQQKEPSARDKLIKKNNALGRALVERDRLKRERKRKKQIERAFGKGK